MHTDGRCSIWRAIALGLVGLASALATSPAPAVTYEAYIGGKYDLDTGNDVKRFEGCIPGGGSVIVGTRAGDTPTRLAQIVMADTNGNLVWRRDYQVNGDTTTGEAIMVVPGSSTLTAGFVITGISAATTTRAYVMRVNCDGDVLWTTTLDTVNTLSGRGAGYDLTMLKSSGGVPQGIIVVGDESFSDLSVNPPITRYYGRITQVNLAGGVVWDRYLHRATNSAGIRLRAVDTLPVTDGTDVAVAGSTSMGTGWSSDRRAFFFRLHLASMTGCGAYLGQTDTTNDDFNGIDAMANGRIGLVGTTQDGAVTTRRVLLGLVNAGSCVVNSHRHWVAGAEGISGEDIVETFNALGQSAGLAITGGLIDATNVGTAHISAVNVANLMPLGAPSPMRFGTNQPQNERLRGIDSFGARVLAAGSREEPNLVDGSNLYLVAPNTALSTTCEVPLPVTAPPTNYFNEIYNVTPPVGPLGIAAPVTPGKPDTKSGFCCAPTPG